MIESKKSHQLIIDQSHKGHSHPCLFETSIEGFKFTVNNFQICFSYERAQKNEDIIIIEQLLRFEEVLPLVDWSRLTFREFESFLRDVNSSPCVAKKDILKKPRSFLIFGEMNWMDVVRVKKGLDIVKQSIGSIISLDFISSCSKISIGFKELHNSGVLKDDHFYKIHEFNSKSLN